MSAPKQYNIGTFYWKNTTVCILQHWGGGCLRLSGACCTTTVVSLVHQARRVRKACVAFHNFTPPRLCTASAVSPNRTTRQHISRGTMASARTNNAYVEPPVTPRPPCTLLTLLQRTARLLNVEAHTGRYVVPTKTTSAQQRALLPLRAREQNSALVKAYYDRTKKSSTTHKNDPTSGFHH